MPLREAAITHVKRALGIAQVAQDVGPVLSAEGAIHFGEYALARCIVHRIDGRELAAGTTRSVFGIPQMQGQRAVQELERDPPRHAVVEDLAEYPLRVVLAG